MAGDGSREDFWGEGTEIDKGGEEQFVRTTSHPAERPRSEVERLGGLSMIGSRRSVDFGRICKEVIRILVMG